MTEDRENSRARGDERAACSLILAVGLSKEIWDVQEDLFTETSCGHEDSSSYTELFVCGLARRKSSRTGGGTTLVGEGGWGLTEDRENSRAKGDERAVCSLILAVGLSKEMWDAQEDLFTVTSCGHEDSAS